MLGSAAAARDDAGDDDDAHWKRTLAAVLASGRGPAEGALEEGGDGDGVPELKETTEDDDTRDGGRAAAATEDALRLLLLRATMRRLSRCVWPTDFVEPVNVGAARSKVGRYRCWLWKRATGGTHDSPS